MNISKRSLLKGLASTALALPFLGLGQKAQAMTTEKASAAKIKGLPVSSPEWTTLGHATDGTDPSTAFGDLPRFTPEIKALESKPLTLTGYVQSLGGGFGKQEYLLSSAPFHCPFCYGGGRASLVRVLTKSHLPETDGVVTLTGTLALQGTDPEEFYFTLKNAKIA